MGLPVEVNNLMMGAVGGYQISRSLRFRSSASAYLNRTPASSGNSQKFTLSAWLKLGATITNMGGLFCCSTNSNLNFRIYFQSNNLYINQYDNGTFVLNLTSTQVFRDPSAWYHIVIAFDTTQATSSNRAKVYVNGVQITAFSTANYPAQNYSFDWNKNSPHLVSSLYSGTNIETFFDGYLAEVYNIDGQALTPSSFGETDSITGVWNPKKYSGTYGTNGFYLNFSDNSGATATTIGKDYSGNGNNWTPNNISVTAGTTYDSMIDSPTPYADGGNGRGNYAVLNPVNNSNGASISAGNLTYAVTASNGSIPSTISMTSGKWYAEMYNIQSSSSLSCGIGAAPVSTFPYNSYLGSSSNQCSFWKGGGGGSPYYFVNGSVQTAYQATAGDVGLMAVDIDNGKMWCGLYRSGTTYWFNSSGGTTGNPETGANPCATFTAGTEMYFGATGQTMSSSTSSINFGQQGFTGTPPSGYKALNTYNLPSASISNGAKHFAATTYTGNGTSQSISNAVNGVSFQPDFVWYKDRSVARDHALFNVISGATYLMSSNNTSAESAVSGTLTSFNSNGYSIGSAANANANGETYVGWQWKGGGTGVTNNSGTITSTVSANTTAGFSVVTYTGNGNVSATVGHGLGVAPSMIIVKGRNDGTYRWRVYHSSLTAGNMLLLDQTSAQQAINTDGGVSSVGSSTFGFSGGVPAVNTNGNTYVAYCFSAVRGYSAFGSYNGTGSSDGAFVFTGFRPRYVMVKSTNTAESWVIWDSSRGPYNVILPALFAQSSNGDSASTQIDFLSNGFKLRNSVDNGNISGTTYIYMAFAENPFNYSRAR